ncbi:MAG: LON peptidase substrate-binding domain-containing protein [Pseudomonadota bacterium]|nr:LON peptidase substrate-binding domain-containing protein [Pseudomonadota bacterium]
MADLPATIAIFPLDGAILLPGAVLPLQIFEPRYLNMIDDAMAGDRLIGMIQTRPGGERVRPRLARVGCVGRITSYAETGDGKYLIALSGVCRFAAGEELDAGAPYRRLRADFAPFEADLDAGDEALEFERTPFMALLERYLERRGLGIEWDAVGAAPAPALVNSLCMALPFQPMEKQALLEARGLEERRAALAALLAIDSAVAGADDEDDPPPALQ